MVLTNIRERLTECTNWTVLGFESIRRATENARQSNTDARYRKCQSICWLSAIEMIVHKGKKEAEISHLYGGTMHF